MVGPDHMTGQLVDRFGRVHRDLRVSVTDRCNLRCRYCMPAEGMVWQDRSEQLSFDEIVRVVAIAGSLGVESVRITGGEPTARAGLAVLVGRLADLGMEVSMTTNGTTLAGCADALADAGLARINVSLDTLQADRFAELTGRRRLLDVLAGIEAASAAGISPVKVNMVVMAGVNDDEVVDMASFGRSHGVQVRFIEFMPLDAQGQWRRSDVVSAADIVAAIDAEFPLDKVPADPGPSPPARLWRYSDGAGHIGVIASVTESFCASCDRVRLTADGQFRSCLFSHDDHDLRRLLRTGAADDDIAAVIREAVAAKWEGHQIATVNFIRPARSMSQIGG